jgi:hypothetical protein
VEHRRHISRLRRHWIQGWPLKTPPRRLAALQARSRSLPSRWPTVDRSRIGGAILRAQRATASAASFRLADRSSGAVSCFLSVSHPLQGVTHYGPFMGWVALVNTAYCTGATN